jgi:hypothetical protein
MQSKFKVTFCLIYKASRHQDVLGSEGIASPSLTPVLHGSELLIHRRLHSAPPPERALSTHWIGGWAGLKIGLDAEK